MLFHTDNFAKPASTASGLSGKISLSVYWAYPYWAPLLTLSYEIDTVKYFDETTKQKYIVKSDQWIIFAEQMFARTYNPLAFYFAPIDSRGVSLFIQMKTNPTNETLIEAMKTKQRYSRLRHYRKIKSRRRSVQPNSPTSPTKRPPNTPHLLLSKRRRKTPHILL